MRFGATLKDKKTIYSGSRIGLELHHLESESDGRRFSREVIIHPGSVVILPILDEKTVVLIRNRRYAVGNVDLLELPAGTLEKGEAPMNCAGRELAEETGFVAGRLKPIADLYPSPGILSEKMYCFLAYDLTPTAMNPDAGEDIEVVPMTFDRAIAMIGSHEIVDAKTIALLLMYDRFGRRGK
jgi:ADP-ribose pyrophosphatase